MKTGKSTQPHAAFIACERKTATATTRGGFKRRMIGAVSKKAGILACSIAALLALPGGLQADQTWDGGGGTGLWNTAANWGADTLPNFASAINFGGTVQTVTNNDLAADTVIGGINFTNTTAGQAFTLGGNRITLGGNIVLTAAGGAINDTIGLDMVLNGTRTFQTATNHSLTISGLISESSAGVGGLLKQGGSGTILTLSNNANSFTGPLTLVSGTISFATIADAGTVSALGAGGTIITGSSAGSAGTLSYTGSGSSTNRQVQIGVLGGSGTVASTIGLVIENVGTGALTFSNANFNALYTTSTGAKTLTLQGTNTGNNQISGVIADNNTAGGGTIALTKDNGGTWILAGLNTYSGQTRIDVGTLSVNTLADSGSSSALGTGSSNSVINIGSSSSNGTLIYTGSGNSTTNRQIQIGRSTVNAGGAIIQNDGSGTLTFSNANFNTSDTTITNTSAARTLSLQGTNTGNNTISGIISNNVGAGSVVGAISLTKTSAGTWLLGGLNTFTGQVRIDNGTLSVNSIANASTASALGTGAVNSVINMGAGSSTGTLIYTGSSNATTDRQIQIGRSVSSTGGAIIQNDGTGTLTFSNANFNTSDTSITSSATRTLTLQGSNIGNNTISGIISNNVGSGSFVGVLSLAKAGNGTWTLAGANTFTGNVFLSAGTLNLNNAGSGVTNSALGTGTLTITGGTIDNTTAGALTLSTNNAVAFNGDFAFGGTQDLNLGTGVVTIGGFSRTLTLNNARTLTMGQLQWNSTSDRTLTVTQGTGSGGKLVIGGFQLSIAGAASSAITRTIAGSGNVDITSAIVNGNSQANNLTYSGTGTLRLLSASNSYTGITSISGGGVLDVGSLASGALVSGGLVFSNSSVLQGNGTFTRSFSGVATASTGQLTGTTGGFAAKGGTLTVNFDGLGTPSTVLLTTGAYRFGTNFVFGSATADSPVIVLNPLSTNGNFIRTLTVVSGLGGDYAELRGALIDTGAFVKEGNGLLILTGANTVTGSLTINAGTVQFGLPTTNSGTTGDVPFSGIANNGSLVFQRSDSLLSYGNVISGIGSLAQSGAGITTLTGANTYSGATTISAGVLQLGNGGTTGSIANTSAITNNGTLALNRTNTLSLATPISGNGVLNQIGTGITALSGTNSYSGGTNVNAGALTYLNTNAKPASGITTVVSGATLGLGVSTSGGFFTSSDVTSLFNGTMPNVTNNATSIVGIDTTAGDFTYATSVTGTTRGLNKLGSNTLSLTGTNSYTGATIVSGGVLKLDSAGAVPGGIASAGGASNIQFNGGVIGLTAVSGNFTRAIGTGVTQVRWLASAIGGFAAFGGDRTVNFGGSATPSQVTWFNTSSSTPGVFGSALVLSDSTSDSTVTILNPIALSNAASSRTITVNGGSAAIDAVLAGVVSSQNTATNGTRLIKNGAGTLALTAANTYVSGNSNPGTTISAGTLMLGNGGGTGSLLYLATITGINSDVSISSGATFAFNRSDAGLVVANTILGAGGVRQVGAGTTTLTGTNTYTGPTDINAGTLAIGGSLSGTSAVNVNTGGTLLLNASNVINNAAPVNLNGGTFNTGGNSQSSPTAAGMGALIIGASSVIDFGSGTSTLWFSSLQSITGTLDVQNWSGSPAGGGTDQLRFTSDPGALVSQISFSGAFGSSAIFFNNGGNSYYEIVPVPEPSSTALLGAAGLLALIGWRERDRISRGARRKTSRA